MLGDQREKADGLLPVLRVTGFGGLGELVGERDAGAVRFVEEVGEFAGQAPGAVGVDGGAVAAAEREDEAGEDGETLDGVHRGGEVERAGQGERGLVEGADGENAGEQEGAASGDAEEGFSEGAGGAAGGEEDKAVGDGKGVFGAGAVDPPLGEDVEERAAGGDGADVHGWRGPSPRPSPGGRGGTKLAVAGVRWGRRRG